MIGRDASAVASLVLEWVESRRKARSGEWHGDPRWSAEDGYDAAVDEVAELVAGWSVYPRAVTGDLERAWLLLGVAAEFHVLPVEVREGANVVAPGHTVSAWCGCRPTLEQHPLGGSRLISHREPTWPDAETWSPGRSN